ncbi:uncharacterized protein BXZ73DRAFT_74141 [Epithele typhae]|uniref:uncharacterized protein n=1 Tax=Epithele typhae TaxID=378194 RepID=UPI0020073995|nr:uncharacterized protein BXZ73DRAFT_74141 [Epithele typhae]KAH9943102.1 hypothetical protein BXZ73DRAFT_74141 [Epithele typhae]
MWQELLKKIVPTSLRGFIVIISDAHAPPRQLWWATHPTPKPLPALRVPAPPRPPPPQPAVSMEAAAHASRNTTVVGLTWMEMPRLGQWEKSSPVDWLSAGLSALQLHVPFKAPGAIEIGDLALDFTQESEVTNSRTVQARMELPFGFRTPGTDDERPAVDIFNTSNLQLATDTMSLKLLRDGAVMGTTLLLNSTLEMGNNSLSVQGNFTVRTNILIGRPRDADAAIGWPNDSLQGLEMLSQLRSTKFESLLAAFESLNINATLPALSSNLLNSASLQVLSTTGENNVSHTTVSLANPFTAALEITHLVQRKSTTTSPALNLNLNMVPQSLLTVTKPLATQAGKDTAPLDRIVTLGGSKQAVDTKRDNIFTYALPSTFSCPRRLTEYCKNLELPSSTRRSNFTKLAAEVALTTGVTIRDYPTMLSYTQPNPIVQNIVSGSVLGIEMVVIKDMQENSNAGSFDAKIAFPEGLTIVQNDKALGSIKMPDVNVVGGVGASFDATFAVADLAKMMLTEEFEWVISGSNLSAAAIGISVPGIGLGPLGKKKVTLKGMPNGLKGGVKIETLDLPSNDPAGTPNITNPSQVGTCTTPKSSDWTATHTLDAMLLLNQTTKFLELRVPGISLARTQVVDPNRGVVAAARLVNAGTGKVLARYADWPQPYRLVEHPDLELKVVADVEEGRAHMGMARPVVHIFPPQQTPALATSWWW